MTKVTEVRWHEVFLLVASLLPNANRFFQTFLEVLDRQIAKYPPLIELLLWAEKKAATSQSSYKTEALRAFYLSSARVRAGVRYHTHPYVFEFTPELAHDFDLARARIVDYTLDLNLVLSLDRTFHHAYDHAMALARIHNRTLTLINVLNQAREASKQLGFTDLFRALDNLVVPTYNAPPAMWQRFADSLEIIISTELQPSPKWRLVEAQAQCLATYLTSTQLLVDCLAVAIVSDRDGIKARLLRPPAPKTKPPAQD